MTRVEGSLSEAPVVTGIPQIAIPPAGTIDIWIADLDQDLWPDALEYLDEKEMVRADRFAQDVHARHFRRGRQMRRIILAGYLELRPERLIFAEGEHGRPFLAGSSTDSFPDFNMSNCGSMAMLAVTTGAKTGLDLEYQRRMHDADPIAERNFHAQEAATVKAECDDAAKDKLFFRCWTRKEAVVKAWGTGMQSDLQSFFVGTAAAPEPYLVRVESGPYSQDSWWLTDISAPPVFAALASSERPERIVIRKWRRAG